MSDAENVPNVACAVHSEGFKTRTMSLGQVTDGNSVSRTTTANEHELLNEAESIAVQLTVCVPIEKFCPLA